MKRKLASESVLVQTLIEANRLKAKAMANGVPELEAVQGVILALKQAWPRTRLEPWHYLCEVCLDTGWREFTCQSGMCGRKRCEDGHTYVEPCTCKKGQSLIAAPAEAPEHLSRLGKKPKPTGWKRIGS